MTEQRFFDDLWVRYKHRNDGSTVAILTYLGKDALVGIGEAKLQPGDHYNQTVGEKIALGRAFIDLGIKGQNRWLLRSRTEAEVKAQRAKKGGTVVYNVAMRPSSLTLSLKDYEDEIELIKKEVNTVVNRPVKKKAKQPR